MHIKDISRGVRRVLFLSILAGLTSLLLIVSLIRIVPLSQIVAPIISIIVMYFVGKKFVPFSKYPETQYYKYGRWTGLFMSLFGFGSALLRNFSFVMANAQQPVGVFEAQALAFLIELTAIIALIAGYIGARSKDK